jgi:hypothetical protein
VFWLGYILGSRDNHEPTVTPVVKAISGEMSKSGELVATIIIYGIIGIAGIVIAGIVLYGLFRFITYIKDLFF